MTSNHKGLSSPAFLLTRVLKTCSLWSIVQQSMPKNFFNFSVKYLNNTLATSKNLCKWSISQSAACSFCLQSESLQRVVSSCKLYLKDGRYTWRHKVILLFLAKTFSSFSDCLLYDDLPSFLPPSVITGDSLRPHLVVISKNSILYILN